MKHQRGFTLMEMTIALVVSALLVSLAYGALRIGVRGWEAANTRVDQVDTMRVGWQFLHQALSNTRAVADPLGEHKHTLFDGAAARLKFVADMPSYLGLGGLYVVELIREEDNEGARLLLRRTLLSEYRQKNTKNRPQQAVLVDELQGIDISYFGRLNDAGLAGWQQRWTNQRHLPTLIRIEVRQENGRHWPLLVARPRLGQVKQAEQSLLDGIPPKTEAAE